MIAITSFVRRQTESSPFSHWTLSDSELLNQVHSNFDKRIPGYRDGVVLVPVDPAGFFCGVTQLKAGDKLIGEFKARKDGEEPRKGVYVVGDKMPAKSAKIVLYRHDVLAENNENETDAEWEIVSVNASPTDEDVPLSVGTLIANHFQLSGGTATNLSDSDFVAMLKRSVDFWKDKALVAPKE